MTGVQTCALPICFPVTIGRVTRITITNAKMVRYMVFDISKILYFTLDLSSLFEGAELVLIHTLVELLLWIH